MRCCGVRKSVSTVGPTANTGRTHRRYTMGKHGPVDGSREGQPSTSEQTTNRQHVDPNYQPKHAKPDAAPQTERR